MVVLVAVVLPQLLPLHRLAWILNATTQTVPGNVHEKLLTQEVYNRESLDHLAERPKNARRLRNFIVGEFLSGAAMRKKEPVVKRAKAQSGEVRVTADNRS